MKMFKFLLYTTRSGLSYYSFDKTSWTSKTIKYNKIIKNDKTSKTSKNKRTWLYVYLNFLNKVLYDRLYRINALFIYGFENLKFFVFQITMVCMYYHSSIQLNLKG